MNESPNLSNISDFDWNAYYIPRNNAKLIKNSIEGGTAPFLPDANGIVKPTQIINANTGFALNAKDLIPVIIEKQNKGYESNAVATNGTMSKIGTRIKQGEKGIAYMFKTGEEFKHAHYYFSEQTEAPEKFNDYVNQNSKQHSALKGQTIEVNSSDEYMAAYVAACKSGAALKVSPAVADDFKQKMMVICENELKKGSERNPDIPKLNDYLFKADQKASQIIKERNPAPKKEVERKDRDQEMVF